MTFYTWGSMGLASSIVRERRPGDELRGQADRFSDRTIDAGCEAGRH